MGILSSISDAVESFDKNVEQQVQRARTDTKLADELLRRWQEIRASIGQVTTPTGLQLPTLALPPTDEPAEMARYIYGEGLPGEFPFNGASEIE